MYNSFYKQTYKSKTTLLLQVVFGLCIILFLQSCKKGEILPNLAPDTRISVDTIALSGKNRLPTEIKLSWNGTDPDGYVVGYEISLDKVTWGFTRRNDSTFRFNLAIGQDTGEIDFYVRSVDNEGLVDPEPDFLRIPIRNTPPVAGFDDKSFPKDTVNLVTTFRWSYNDADGSNTVTKAFLRVNNGAWTEVDRSKIIISVVPENSEISGVGDGLLYYDNNETPASVKLPGLNNEGNNTFYLKVLDQSGAESTVDTSSTVFVKKRNSDLLILAGQPEQVNQKYLKVFNTVYTQGFDYLDLYDKAGENQPKFWTPTFTLLLLQYPKVFVNSDQSAFTHPVTGVTLTLLEFMAPSFQKFNNQGGKSFITTSFKNGADLTALKGPFPIDSLSLTKGQALIDNDSVIYSVKPGYPELSPTFIVLGSDPHHFSPDAEAFYKVDLTPASGWKGPNTVASRRMVGGKVRQVFFSVELHLFDKDLSKLNDLFDTILNVDLN